MQMSLLVKKFEIQKAKLSRNIEIERVCFYLICLEEEEVGPKDK